MDLVELTSEIVKSLVVNEDGVTVKEFPTDEDNTILIQVMVDEEDMGRVIGKNGRVINSIRLLVQASSSLKDGKRVRIDVDKF